MRNALIFVIAISVPVVVGLASNFPRIGVTPTRIPAQQVLELKLVPVQGVTFRGKIAEDCRNHDSDIVVTVTREGFEINKQFVAPEKFKEVIVEIFGERRCKIAFLDIDSGLSYGEFTKVVDIMIGEGVIVNLMTDGLKKELGYAK